MRRALITALVVFGLVTGSAFAASPDVSPRARHHRAMVIPGHYHCTIEIHLALPSATEQCSYVLASRVETDSWVALSRKR